jgi:CMP-N-acetylneuraminic acid synthetase/spore coat polysaccharide biosynthesis predicted glycosyltransferase SpsG
MTDRPERHVPLLCVVPARGGSRGILRKNLRTVAGKPLLLHTLETIRRSGVATRIVVSTDDPQIAGVARLHGYEVLDRPAELANDTATLADVIKHAVETLAWNDNVLLAQPTCPLLTSGTVVSFVSEFRRLNFDWAIAGTRLDHIMWQDGRPLTGRKNRQQLATDSRAVWRESGALQMMTAETARTGNGQRTMIPIPEAEALDIDTHADLAAAQLALGRKTIEFRVVASDEKGSGHLYRCLALSDALSHHDVRWSPHGLEGWAYEIVHSRGVRVCDFSQPDDVIPADLVVIDCLDQAETLVPAAKARGSKVVVFEPEGADVRGADLVLDEFADPRYAVLRPEFLGLPAKRMSPKGDHRILVTFGGTDVAGLSGRVASMLSFACDAEVRVVIGPGAKRPEGPVFVKRVEVLDQPNMAEQMCWADLVVCSQGRTVAEAVACGTPVVAIAANERESRHARIPGVVYLGLHVQVGDQQIIDTANRLLGRAALRQEMVSTASQYVDGLGVDRIVMECEKLLRGL